MSSPQDGPSLETYIETRFNLLAEVIKTSIETARDAQAAVDRRYEQRFEAQEKAVSAAFAAQKEAINAALAAADRAVTKAETAVEKRLEGVNEFRQTLDNQQKTLITRSEVGEIRHALTEKMERLTKTMDMLQAERQGLKGGWAAAVAVVMFVVTVMTLVAFGLKAFGQ